MLGLCYPDIATAQTMGIETSHVECVRFGKGMRVTYLLTNTSNKQRYLNCVGMQAIMDDGSMTSGSWYMMGVTQNTGGDFDAPGIVLLPGVPAKCEAFFKSIPDLQNKVSNLRLDAFVRESENNGVSHEKSLGSCIFSLGAAVIKPLPKSNQKGVYFTNSDFLVSYDGCTRNINGSVKMSFAITNTTKRNIELYSSHEIGDPFPEPATVYDSNGSKYVCSYFGDRSMSLFIDGKKYSYMSDKIIMEPGVAKHFVLTINNVPQTINTLSRVGIWMRNKEYSHNDGNRLTPTELVFKNISIK